MNIVTFQRALLLFCESDCFSPQMAALYFYACDKGVITSKQAQNFMGYTVAPANTMDQVVDAKWMYKDINDKGLVIYCPLYFIEGVEENHLMYAMVLREVSRRLPRCKIPTIIAALILYEQAGDLTNIEISDLFYGAKAVNRVNSFMKELRAKKVVEQGKLKPNPHPRGRRTLKSHHLTQRWRELMSMIFSEEFLSAT